MTPKSLARHLNGIHAEHRLDHLHARNCRHAVVMKELEEIVQQSAGVLEREEVGRSLEGRPLYCVTAGRGHKRILLWSQMHGDEPTATLALMDMFAFLAHETQHTPWVREMLDETLLVVLPMLNPDGAERRQRRTALGIDMNRDALSLSTPEARVLSDTHTKVQPSFAFNLHDQELSTVGESTAVTAIALLAPTPDSHNSMPRSRQRARRIAALISCVLEQFVKGHIARYPDAYESRAFGDTIQARGTSTVLIESGHWPNDRGKEFIRRLNFVALLCALRSIGNGSYQDIDLDYYTDLPENGKLMYDIIIRGLTVQHPSGVAQNADLGLSIDPVRNRDSIPLQVTIKDLGDLRTFGALETIDGHGRVLPADALAIEEVHPLQSLLDLLQIHHPLRASTL